MGHPHRGEDAVAEDPQEGGEEIGEHRRLPEGAVAAEQVARGDEARLLQVGSGVDERGASKKGLPRLSTQVYQANRQGSEEKDGGNPQAPAVPHQAVEAAAQAGSGGCSGGNQKTRSVYSSCR